MENKNLFGLLFLLVISQPLSADTLAISPDHPESYVVVKGDTLWDISGRFLEKPWFWPEIWDRNPQIENPHLIYPGDVVSLVYGTDGKPILRVKRGAGVRTGRSVVKLSPSVRSTPITQAIPTIPLDAISQFLNGVVVATEEQIDSAPYVVSMDRERLMGASDNRIYARGLPADGFKRVGIFRQGKPYNNPESGEMLGYEALHVGSGVVEREGDPATVKITTSNREILSGDRLFEEAKQGTAEAFIPNLPNTDISGTIISVVDGVTQIGQHNIVVLNLGGKDVAVGDVLAVYQKGATVRDNLSKSAEFPYIGPDGKTASSGLDEDIDLFVEGIRRYFTKDNGELVTLPDERAGVVMIFRTFDRVSYALVMEASRAIHLHDYVTNL